MPVPSETLEKIAHDIYPGIAPEKFAGTNTGRVVLITGASRGIGVNAAKAFAASGASLFLTARDTAKLENVKAEIEAEYKVPVGTAAMEVIDGKSVKDGVDKAVEMFGKIDVVIANAGGGSHVATFGDGDYDSWVANFRLNAEGTASIAHYALPELRKTKGYVVLVSSSFAHERTALLSAYTTAKLAVARIAELIHIENHEKGVKAFALHPGLILTDLTQPFVDYDANAAKVFSDSPDLGALTEVRLVSGSEDWLSGRYVDSTWNLDELAKRKDAILEDDALKIRLALPHSA